MVAEDLFWPAGSLSSFDSVVVGGADVKVHFRTSGLVAVQSLTSVVVMDAVWVCVIALPVDVLGDFCSSLRPLLLCSTAVAAAGVRRTLLEDLLLFRKKKNKSSL